MTPGNLRKYGDPDYETLANCLGLLPEYNRSSAKKDNDETKVEYIYRE